ncbi:hypothetical protein CHS0354_009129 [Potamilus streckersoni]|uniref:Uncharacterized protein n=1 Tax=Potamilus streckersoni TaxID=2493646 RepID=A0AAE0SRN8_9BIVA|nr:hypothetical protein CHS0354_009129 [Potamilus streckersoni]
MTILGYRQYDYKLIYPTEEPDVSRYSVNKGRICRQSIRLDYTEPKQKIANIIGKSLYPECICREWIGETRMLSQIEKPCDMSSVEPSDESNKRFIYGGIVQGNKDITKYPFAKIFFLINITYNQQRIAVGPLVCNEDEGMIQCDKGHPVLKKTRCLYDEDSFGSPIGCADMSHTRHCETFICPPNFVKCPGSYCLAVRLMCDGLQQCPNGEDEADCGSRGRVCPGYFRCNQSNICLSPSQVCDGFNHCPAGDDEKFCNTSCSSMCVCQGTFVDCRNGRINNTQLSLLSPQSRKIFFSNSTIGNINAPFNLPVAYLVNLSNCAIDDIQPGVFENMTNLRTLDISHNKLTVLHKSTFKGLVRLRELLITNICIK